MRRWFLVSLCLLFAVQLGFAAEAKTYTIKLPNAADIKSTSGHLDIIFVCGWASQKDSFILKLLSNNHNTAASISATGTYWDQEQLKNAWVIENSDIPGNKLDRPWGASNKILMQAIPADTLIPNIVVQFALHKEDRIKQVLGLFQSAAPGLGVGVQPYLTYATLVDGFFSTFFGTDKTRYPFLMDTGLSDPNVTSPDGMYEHYLVGISPNKEGDAWLTSLDGSKLGFNAASKILTYNGQPVTDHSFAIFLVRQAPAPDIPQLLLESNAPWAALALSTFYESPLPKVTKKDDISAVETQYIKNLSDCTGLLKRELRFSAYDRAKALSAFATNAKTMIADSCKGSGIANADCSTPQLDHFISQIGSAFGFVPSGREALLPEARTLNQQIEAAISQQK